MILREEEELLLLLLVTVVENNHHLKRSDLSELSLFLETFVFNVFSSFKIRLHLLKRSTSPIRSNSLFLSSPFIIKVALKRKREREEREREERRGAFSLSLSRSRNNNNTNTIYVSNRTLVPLLRVLRKLVQKEFRVYLGLETLSCMSQKKKHYTQTQRVASSKTTNKRTDDDDDEQQQEEAKRALVEKMSRSRRALTFPLAGDYDRGGCVLLFVVWQSSSSSSRG